VTSLTFCDGEGDEGFTALTKIGPQIMHGAVVDPYPGCLVSGCMTHTTGRQGTNVSKATVGLSVPLSGFMKSNAFCIVSTFPDAMI